MAYMIDPSSPGMRAYQAQRLRNMYDNLSGNQMLSRTDAAMREAMANRIANAAGTPKYSGAAKAARPTKYRIANANASASTASTASAASAAPKGKLFKKGGFFSKDGAGKSLSGWFGKATSPEFDYNSKTGLQGWGHDLGGWITAANAIGQGYQAIQNIDAISDARDASDRIMSDIVSASYASPTIQYDLSPDQLNLLRELRQGAYDSGADLSDIDLLGALSGAGMGVLTGIGGGIPGMVVGGIGGLINSGLGDLNNAQNINNSELEALYQAVQESAQQHNAARKQRAYANLIY